VKQEKKLVRQIGKRFRELREAQNLSQEELAASAEVDLSHLGKLERGEGNPTIELIVRIATTLNAGVEVVIK
jgi:transcriptional regulator with XRE-family HTH domain